MTATAVEAFTTIAPRGANSRYLAHIDGLRAIAVLAVIFGHAGFTVVGGGWVGVDIFFVISGFLITGILRREHREGTFSFRGFYLRRVRRIVPALTVVVAACFPFAWFLMFPDFIQNFGQSAVATMLGANNILLALTSGYWELESAFKPLLHTWSLGVEEQFYLAYPLVLALILWVARRRTPAVVAVLALFALGSLVIAEFAVRSNPDMAFYLPQYRAWELLAGGLATFVKPAGRRGESLLPAVGLAAVLGSIVLFTEDVLSPSAWLLVPVVGAVLILVWGGSDRLVRPVLSWRPLVVIGLISYSAYLIHQPVFAFIRVASLSEPSPWLFGALVIPILGASWLSWKYIETPFRNPARVSGRKLALVLVPSVVGILVLGLAWHVSQGYPQRAFPNIEAGGDVYISYNESVREVAVGSPGAPAQPEVVVVGNSFGRDAANVLLEANPRLEGRLAYADTLDLGLLGSVVSPDTVIVLAVQGGTADGVNAQVDALRSLAPAEVYVFGTKNFGWNLNAFARVPMEERAEARVAVLESTVELNDELSTAVPEYVDIITLLGGDGRTVPVFDEAGNPLSPDRVHLTKYGARLIAEKLEEDGSPLASLD